MNTRTAVASDADAIARLVNRAYAVEAFFVEGDRTTAEAVFGDLTSGTILVVDDPPGAVSACIYLEVRNGAGYFGMLAVDPDAQGRGLGRALITAAENHARETGATTMDITVVNLRTELLAFYARLGYVAIGTEPYAHRPVTQPVHFIRMRKAL